MTPYPPGTFPPIGYGTAVGNLFNSTAPDKGVGVNITIPLRNRVAQADQARSQMEYRQVADAAAAALHADPDPGDQRAVCVDQRPGAGEAAQAGRDYAAQRLDAEQKKYKLGASTTAKVLQQRRNLASAENTLISATAAYAKDRAALRQLTVEHAGCVRDQHYGCGGGRGDDRAGDSGADGSDGSGAAEADFGGAGSDRSSWYCRTRHYGGRQWRKSCLRSACFGERCTLSMGKH